MKSAPSIARLERDCTASAGRPLRVCHLGKYYPPAAGGIETHVRTLAQAQAELGLDVSVLCMNHERGPTRRENDGPVRVTRFRPLVSAAKIDVCPLLVKELALTNADVLHLQVPNPTMILAILIARPRRPIVVTYQSDLVRQRLRARAFRPLERLAYRQVRAILPTSPTYAAGSEFLRGYEDRTHVLPMGIDLEPYLNPSPRTLAAADEIRRRYGPGPIWLGCGRMIYYKGFHNAIRALPHCPGTLLLVGDGPDLLPLVDQARRLNVLDRVHFLGGMPYQKIVPYYHAATAFWFPSNARSEAFGIVQLEAMASGCPVINTSIPHSGVAWVSKHDESGLTVPMDDPEALAAAATRLASDPDLRARLSTTARARARDEFDQRTMAERSIAVYERVLSRRTASRPPSLVRLEDWVDDMHAIAADAAPTNGLVEAAQVDARAEDREINPLREKRRASRSSRASLIGAGAANVSRFFQNPATVVPAS